MNILYYQHQFPAIGGIETVTATLSNYFVAQGHRVTVVSHIDKKVLGAGTSLDGRVAVLHTPDVDRVTARNTRFLQRTIRERKIDVVIFQDSYAQIERNLFVEGLNVPVVTCEHNAPYAGMERPRGRAGVMGALRRFLRPCLDWRHFTEERARRRFLYERSARYVLLSDRFFGEFRTIAGLTDCRKLLAIPNPSCVRGVDVDARKKRDEIVFVGTLNPLKGCDLLIAAWGKIAQSHPAWSLTIVGDGSERLKLEQQAKGIPNVAFVGYRKDPRADFARAKIFAFPSRREGWGLVLVEAMAHGCVPVAFDSYAAVRDIVQNNVNGFIVPAFDIDAFANALKNLIEQESKLCEMARCCERGVGRFDVDAIAPLWERLLKDTE